ncbi:MAG: T9SS type A sorting domain-containing protein, partial [Saprospiraceae bacterium]
GTLKLEQMDEEQFSLGLIESMYANQSATIKVYQGEEVSGEFYAAAEMMAIFMSTPKVNTLAAYTNEGKLTYWIEFSEAVELMSTNGNTFMADEMEIVFESTSELQSFQNFVVSVQNEEGKVVLAYAQGKYPEPQILSATPNTLETGEKVVVTGENLGEVSLVEFNSTTGGMLSVNFSVLNEHTLEVVVPSTATNTLRLTSFYGAMAETPLTISEACNLPANLNVQLQRTEEETGANLTWLNDDGGGAFEVQYRAAGSTNWISDYVNATELFLADLDVPAEYEWRVKATCNDEFTTVNTFSTDYGNTIYVSEVLNARVEEWITLDPESGVSIFDFIEEADNIEVDEKVSFFRSYTNGAWPNLALFAGPCYCKTIQVHTSIQVEPGTGMLNRYAKTSINSHSNDNKGYRRHSYREYYIEHGPAFHMKHVYSGHRRTKHPNPIYLHKGTVPPNFSKMTMTYLCTQGGVQQNGCGCMKELDIDVRYESNHWMHPTNASQRSSHVKAKTEEYAFIYDIEQPSNKYNVLYADFAGKKKMDKVSWNPTAFINVVNLAATIGKAILANKVTAQDITSVQNTLNSMITTPFQIKDFAASGSQGIGIGGKQTLMIKPNTTRTIAMYSNGSVQAEGKGKGKSRWHATAEIHSNYRMSMVFEPRPPVNTPWCCTQSIGMWDLGSLGGRAPKSAASLRNSIGAHLISYHTAQDWIGLNTIYYGGIHHLDIQDNRYYRVLAKNTCPPYQAPPNWWDYQVYSAYNYAHLRTAQTLQQLTSSIAPNPFSNVTTINYELPENTNTARLVVYNLNGVALKNFSLARESSRIDISANGMANGMYYYLIFADGQQISRNKMMVQK